MQQQQQQQQHCCSRVDESNNNKKEKINENWTNQTSLVTAVSVSSFSTSYDLRQWTQDVSSSSSEKWLRNIILIWVENKRKFILNRGKFDSSFFFVEKQEKLLRENYKTFENKFTTCVKNEQFCCHLVAFLRFKETQHPTTTPLRIVVSKNRPERQFILNKFV